LGGEQTAAAVVVAAAQHNKVKTKRTQHTNNTTKQ
jgi:hypothetical protein